MKLSMKKDYGNEIVNMFLKMPIEKGFTLIEILVALSILLIIVSAFLVLYAQSYSKIIYSGDKIKALYEAQQELDGSIEFKGINGTDEIEIKFPGLERSIKSKGSIERFYIKNEYYDTYIEAFVPNKGEEGR